MGQTLSRSATPDYVLRRKGEAYTILDEICQELELSEAQYEAAKTSYEAVADWLGKSTHPTLRMLSLYAHGSTALGTTVRPLAREDFDVDLICLVLGLTGDMPPAELKKLIGDRLREHGQYAAMLEEKKRCWRLNYAREFHIDISPTIPNQHCNNLSASAGHSRSCHGCGRLGGEGGYPALSGAACPQGHSASHRAASEAPP